MSIGAFPGQARQEESLEHALRLSRASAKLDQRASNTIRPLSNLLFYRLDAMLYTFNLLRDGNRLDSMHNFHESISRFSLCALWMLDSLVHACNSGAQLLNQLGFLSHPGSSEHEDHCEGQTN